jgi:hypothetical protein
MLRFRSVSKVLLTGLLFTLLLLMPACAGEEAAIEGEVATEAPASTGEAIQLPETEAGGILAAALAEAGETDRYVFVHTGADW